MAKHTATTTPDETPLLPAEIIPETDWSQMSYADALATFSDDIVAADSETMGDGFEKLPSKDLLIGVPFLIVRGTFTPGIGKRKEKVTVRIVTSENKRYFFSDGSAGIYSQLRKLVPELQSFGQVHAVKGLRASRFHWDEQAQMVTKDGPPNAATYYIDVA